MTGPLVVMPAQAEEVHAELPGDPLEPGAPPPLRGLRHLVPALEGDEKCVLGEILGVLRLDAHAAEAPAKEDGHVRVEHGLLLREGRAGRFPVHASEMCSAKGRS